MWFWTKIDIIPVFRNPLQKREMSHFYSTKTDFGELKLARKSYIVLTLPIYLVPINVK